MNLLHNDLETLLTPGTVVAHFKRDKYLKEHRLDADFDKNMYLYQVCGLATDVDSTNHHCVVYQAMYGRREVFVRPIDDFLSSAGTSIDMIHVPRFSVYGELVEVINPQIPVPKKHNAEKKLHKKIKNLAAEVKKLREENDQLKKEAANRHALKKTVKDTAIQGQYPRECSTHTATMDTAGATGKQGQHLREDGTYVATTDAPTSTENDQLKKSVKNPSISVVPDTVKEASPLSSSIDPKVVAELPIEPQSAEAKELADALWHAAEDALLESVPKELLK